MAEKMDAKLDYNNQESVEKTAPVNRKLRVGIIGCGWIAGSHIDSYKRMEDVDIVAGCDLIPGKAAAFFERNGVYVTYFPGTFGSDRTRARTHTLYHIRAAS